MNETLQTKSEALPTRQAKRSAAFFRMDVESCVDHVDSEAEQYHDRENFIRAVILELEKLQ